MSLKSEVIARRTPTDRRSVPVALSMSIALLVSSVGCGSSRPLMINPSISVPEGIQCPKSDRQFFLDDVIDKRGNADHHDVGFTQTGMFNVLATLRTTPPPAEILQKMLASYLDRCGARSASREDADCVLSPSLITLQLTELTGLTETIAIDLACEITLRTQASGKLVERSIVDAKSSRQGMDTTSYATAVIEQSSRTLVARVGELLERCP